jgi:phosphonate transport system permease protein
LTPAAALLVHFAALLVLVVASFVSLDLDWASFASMEAARSMGRFVAEFFPPDLSPVFVNKVAWAAWETLAMSALGTAMAAVLGLALAVPASRMSSPRPGLAAQPHALVAQCLARHS